MKNKPSASTAIRKELWEKVQRKSATIKRLRARIAELEALPPKEVKAPDYKSAESDLLELIYQDLVMRCDMAYPPRNGEIDMSDGIWQQLERHVKAKGGYRGRVFEHEPRKGANEFLRLYRDGYKRYLPDHEAEIHGAEE